MNHETGKQIIHIVGLGPGDPELITVKGKTVLEHSDIVFYPSLTKNGKKHADGILRAILPKEPPMLKEMYFPPVIEPDEKEPDIIRNIGIIVEAIKKGLRVSFAVLGDPVLFSTFVQIKPYLSRHLPDLCFEIVPGISSISAGFSSLSIAMGKDKSSIGIISAPDNEDDIIGSLQANDTLIILKAGKRLEMIKEALEKLGLEDNAHILGDVSSSAEKHSKFDRNFRAGEFGYMTLVIVKK